MFALDTMTFRLLLISAALALIVILFIFSYRRRKTWSRRENLDEIHLGPLFDQDEEQAVEEEPATAEGTDEDRIENKEEKPDPDNRNVISISLRSRRREGFNGKQLLSTLERFNLEYGDMDIFHRAIQVGTKRNISFSVLNGMEPGTLKKEDLEKKGTPIIIFFIRLHRCHQPLKAFNEMVDVAQQFALLLDGQLYDDRDSHLAPQTVSYYRDLIREFILNEQVRQARKDDDS